MVRPQIFIQLEPLISAKPKQLLRIEDVASIVCDDNSLKEELFNIPIMEVPDNTKNTVIFLLDIIELIKEKHNNFDIVVFGDPEILVNIELLDQSSRFIKFFKVVIVCIVLFFGGGLAIINFHEDVEMEEAHRKIYYTVVGEREDNPVPLQIPYSIGIGLGMAVFFNHIFKRKWKKEPSPLEVKMYTYDKGVNEYILDKTKHIDKAPKRW